MTTLTQIQELNCIEATEALLDSGNITAALDALFDGLMEARETMDRAEWLATTRFLREEHSLREVILQDPMTSRAYNKPRGYAGDAVMMDFLYRLHSSNHVAAEASAIGREIFRYIQSRPAGQAVRFRREHIAGLINDMALAKSNPTVLAIASGHLREAELCAALSAGAVGRFVALDADADSLAEVKSNYAKLGVETIHGSVRHILARKLNLGTFDFVYAAGLYDYLNDAVAQALTARMFDLTNPGGEMLIPNFAPSVKDRAYMETYMDWDLIYRDEYDMVGLLARIDPTQIESYDVYSDPTNSVVYLRVKKK